MFDSLEVSTDVVEKIVVQRLGSEFELGGVIRLQDLGRTTWPRNIGGKLSMKELESSVEAYNS